MASQVQQASGEQNIQGKKKTTVKSFDEQSHRYR
jgi:hypothetical protein